MNPVTLSRSSADLPVALLLVVLCLSSVAFCWTFSETHALLRHAVRAGLF